MVNGESVTMDEFVEHLKNKGSVRVNTGQGVAELPVADTLAYQGLDDLIKVKLVEQMAKDEGVYPTPADVTKELEFRKKLDPAYVTNQTARGITFGRLKQLLTFQLAQERLVSKGVTVPMEEVEKFIKENPAQFKEPATVDLLWAFVKTEAGKARIDADLKTGQSFSSVAMRYSEAPNARGTNARFAVRAVDQLPPAVKSAVGNTAEGRTTGWVSGDGGWAKFYIEKRTPAKPVEMTLEKKQFVQRELARARGTRASDLVKRLDDKLSEADIKVQQEDLAALWKAARERAAKEKEANTQPAAAVQPNGAPQPTGTTG